MSFKPQATPIQKINDPILDSHGISLFIKREDLIHPYISGNKWHKLKYNIQQAKAENKNTILTFGGAFSNHIAATAFAGKEYEFKTIGIIRGEEHFPLNDTLKFATACGMRLKYINRTDYRLKNETDFIENLRLEFDNFYLVPEGGSNIFALKGCSEVLENNFIDFDYLTVACGTGATLAGLSISLKNHQQALGFPALKGGEFLSDDIKKFILNYNKHYDTNHEAKFRLITDYHYGGYAKTTPELINFVKTFNLKHHIPLDYIYTGKMMFGIFDLVEKGFFKRGSKILAIHTGGLQGNEGIEKSLMR